MLDDAVTGTDDADQMVGAAEPSGCWPHAGGSSQEHIVAMYHMWCLPSKHRTKDPSEKKFAGYAPLYDTIVRRHAKRIQSRTVA